MFLVEDLCSVRVKLESKSEQTQIDNTAILNKKQTSS